MRILTKQQLDTECQSELEILVEGEHGKFRAVYKLDMDVGALTTLAKALCSLLSTSDESILIVTGNGAFTQSQNKYVVEVFRAHFGENRSLIEAPVHVFGKDELDRFASFFALCLYNFYDFIVFSADRAKSVKVSNDHLMLLSAIHEDDFKAIQSVLKKLELQPVRFSDGAPMTQL